MGIYGINVKIKMVAGNKAMKKLNAIARALVFISLSLSRRKKNRATSYKGNPSNPGRLIRFADFKRYLTGFISVNIRSKPALFILLILN